jgi:RNA polymerase sigma factor (sigma-70 family)
VSVAARMLRRNPPIGPKKAPPRGVLLGSNERGVQRRMGPIGPKRLGPLFDTHAGPLALYARQWCDDPEDIVQDAFVALARQRSWPDQVVPWLYRVVRNAAIAASRHDRRRQKREGRAASGASAAWFAATDDLIDAAAASRLVAELDSETREVIVARIWGGLTFDEIARLQGCSLTTAHRRYHAGLARLQERLEPS